MTAELQEEVKLRCPVEPEPIDDDDILKPLVEEILKPGDLFGTVLISSKDDLDSWLGSIRGQLTELLESGKRIKVVGGEK